MKGKRRNLDAEVQYCKLSLFASVCAVLSLLVHTYNYVEHDGLEARSLMDDVLDDKLGKKFEEYFAGAELPRRKREAMLVSICLDST